MEESTKELEILKNNQAEMLKMKTSISQTKNRSG
jgi:hypothetical protein